MTLNLAYKFVAMTLMVAESNVFCSKTGLAPGHSFISEDVRQGSHVGPFNPKDFGGSIVTDRHLFGFGWGHLANFRKRGFMPQDSDQAIRERNLELAKFSSLIDTNGAYDLATNWLAALGLDLATMERKYRLNFIQWRYYPEGTGGKVSMLPVYTVEWPGFILRSQPKRESAVVSVTVFGATKELVEYHVLDDSLFLRPRIQIKDPEELLAIPDEEFRKLDSAQRSNLVVRFAGVTEKPRAPQFIEAAPVPRTNVPLLPKVAPDKPSPLPNGSPQTPPEKSLGIPQRLRSPPSEVHLIGPAKPTTNLPSTKP
jgi:hypothetical protein